jgi:hypothetical protein
MRNALNENNSRTEIKLRISRYELKTAHLFKREEAMKKLSIIIITATALCGAAQANMDLATVPTRDTVQLTIYNSADLTLVREQRALTLKEGMNKLQFSWANTLIDPTSLEMTPKANADKIDIQELVFPPRVQNLGLWNVKSGVSGKSPVEISYLTSGLSWRAFYMGTLTPDESKLRLQGYVRVTNNSGEDYENAQTRLIVGEVHLVDQIADLARRPAYGQPGWSYSNLGPVVTANSTPAAMESTIAMRDEIRGKRIARKQIVKEGLSEYFLYTIEGTETIPNTWSKRLPSFDTEEIPVENLYKFEEERYGSQVIRFLSFDNDEAHELGDTPIPGGAMKVYGTGRDGSPSRPNDALGQHALPLTYVGASNFKYIPVGEEVELDLGAVQNVIVEPTLMKFATDRYRFYDGNVSGWDEIRDFKVEVRNTRSVPVKVEIKRTFSTSYWELEKAGDFGTYEKDDLDTVKFTLELPPESKKTFTYQVTTHHGDNQ